MRGLLLREFGQAFGELAFVEIAAVAPGPRDVVIDVAACGVNFPDLLVVGGTYQSLPELPFVLGKELAGTVAAIGAEVRRVSVGDRVMSQLEDGAFAERVVVPEERVFRIPDDLAFDEAAAFGLVYSTAYVALTRRGRYQRGETVMVTAANGSVGSAAVQIAAALGATTIAVVREAAVVARAEADGADHVIAAADPSSLRDDVRALTGSHGADVVIESVGGAFFDASLRATAWQGRLVSVGYASGDIPTVKAGHLLVKNIEVSGMEIHGYLAREPSYVAEALERILALRAAGAISIRVARRFDISDPGSAFEAVARGGLAGRVVLEVGR